MPTFDQIVVAVDGRYPITLPKGGYWSRLFVVRDEDGDRIGLSGYVGRAQIRDEPDGTLLLTFRVTLEGGNSDVEKKGEVLVEALSEDSAFVTQGGVWDCRLFRTNSEPIDVIALSPVELDRRVTL